MDSTTILRLSLIVAGVFLVALVLSRLAAQPSPEKSSFIEPPRQMLAGGQVRDFYLNVQSGSWEISKDFSVDAWTYNGKVPGPELRVREGDLVRIKVKNSLSVPTTIHWHGVELPNAMDGVPGITQRPIQPGETFTYEFVAYPAGTRMYHSHQDPSSQLELGLYGALIIEPRRPEPVHYDREYVAILDELAQDFTPGVALGQEHLEHENAGNGRGGALQYDFFLINGKAADAIPPIEIKKGERILLRLINLGSLPHSMHLHGHTFTIVAADGNPVPPAARLRKDTVLLGPGERYDLEIVGTNPGVWLFHCHMLNHGENGMMTFLHYAGFPSPTQLSEIHGHAATPPEKTEPAPTSETSVSNGQEVVVEMLDNRFSPGKLTVKVGTTVTWVNHGNNRHTTTGIDSLLWNSKPTKRDEKFSVTFTKPGTYRYICRQHILNGMVGTIVVQE
ncbi:multicopper oxidase family protein [Candidatus Acetothermia bacterium]|nr:multicopper oxidase family protein [Candidatus Acetothermia bacterium]MBI3461115.1 multicopper oxidase family protein [Candidatus Acetothermia bacterium]